MRPTRQPSADCDDVRQAQKSALGEGLRFSLDGKVALVTGAGRGIGRGCALALAEAGAEVIAVSRTEDELKEVVGEIDKTGGHASLAVCDVSDPERVSGVIGSVEQLDVVVNAAGTNFPEPFLEVSEEHLDTLLALNVKGTFLVCQAATRRIIQSAGAGAIVNISSQMGHVGAKNRSVYCTTKHAVEGLTRALAVELASAKVRVNTVAPTFIETPMTKPFFEDPSFRREVEAQIPLGRVGEVGDVVGAVVFLASPAASLITGASLLVDGGWTAH